MGEISKLGWLIGLVNNGHMGQLLIFSIPAVAFNFQNPGIIPAYSMTLSIILIFLE
jgi:hypothetical protein